MTRSLFVKGILYKCAHTRRVGGRTGEMIGRDGGVGFSFASASRSGTDILLIQTVLWWDRSVWVHELGLCGLRPDPRLQGSRRWE